MTILKILIYPNNKLRTKTKPVLIFNKNLKKDIKHMYDTMYYHNAIGLAAIQININKSIITIDISNNKKKKLTLINPNILYKSEYILSQEQCLSLPNYCLQIKRYNSIILSSYNKKGKKFYLHAKGLLAICIQHEIDHLNGLLIIDYI